MYRRHLTRLTTTALLSAIFITSPSYSRSCEQHYDTETKLTPNDELIISVKGIKYGAALYAGIIHPLLGVLVAAHHYEESEADLINIDKALAAGAGINFQEESSGYTALIYAAYYGYPKIARHLLQRGANVDIKEDKGYNAYTMAVYYVDDYKKISAKNDVEPVSDHFDEAKRVEMRQYYAKRIKEYQEVVDTLEGLTTDRTMPQRSWFF